MKQFVSKLPKEKRDNTLLVMKTQPIDDNGTDLIEVVKNCAPELNVLFFAERNDERHMNFYL